MTLLSEAIVISNADHLKFFYMERTEAPLPTRSSGALDLGKV